MSQDVFKDPVAGAVVPDGSNVGDGGATVTTAFYGMRTEIYTLTANSVGPGANFDVVGSVSGALGVVQSGVSQVVSSAEGDPVFEIFIVDGSTPFAISDEFEFSGTAGTELRESEFDKFNLEEAVKNGGDANAPISATELGLDDQQSPTPGRVSLGVAAAVTDYRIELPGIQGVVGQAMKIKDVQAGTPDTLKLEWGTAGGGSGINYLELDAGITWDFETGDTQGWDTYTNNTAGPIPELSPGAGNGDVVLSVSDVNPLRGLWSAIITKLAANTQGSGFRTEEFDIDLADTNGFLAVKFDYEVSQEHFQVFASDGTNIIPLTNGVLKIGSRQFVGAFYTTASTTYRLIFHVFTDETGASNLKIDNVQVGPMSDVFGFQDTEKYSAPLSGSGNFTDGTVEIFRVGKSVTISTPGISHTSLSAPTSAAGLIPLRFRPDGNLSVVFQEEAAGNRYGIVFADGSIGFEYRDNAGGARSITNGGRRFSFNYEIADANYQGVAPLAQFISQSEVEPLQDWTSQASLLEDGGNSVFESHFYQRIGALLVGWGAIRFTGAGTSNSVGIVLPYNHVLPSVTVGILPSAGDVRVSASGTANRALAILGASGTTPGSLSITAEESDSRSGISSGRTIQGNYFSNNGRIEFNYRVPISEADRYSQIVEVKQRDYGVTNQTASAVTDDTNVDIVTFPLPRGQYKSITGARMTVVWSGAIDYARGRVWLANTSNTELYASDLTGLARSLSGTHSASYSNQGQFDWPGGDVKLRGRVAAVGGTVTSRSILNAFAQIVRIGD